MYFQGFQIFYLAPTTEKSSFKKKKVKIFLFLITHEFGLKLTLKDSILFDGLQSKMFIFFFNSTVIYLKNIIFHILIL